MVFTLNRKSWKNPLLSIKQEILLASINRSVIHSRCFLRLCLLSLTMLVSSLTYADSLSIDSKENNQLLASEENRLKTQLKNNPWLFLHPYNATYEVHSDGEKLGNAKRQLENNNGIWKLLISTKLKKWLLSLKSYEYSDFLIAQKELFSQKFYTETDISFKKARKISQEFNWADKLETGHKGKKNWQLPLDEHVYDRMSHILKLRADLLTNKRHFEYLISYKGKHKTYRYKKADIEIIKTQIGEYATLRMDRIKGDDSDFSIWLCPELDYFPIKIAQFEQDKPDVILTLAQLDYLKTPEL